MSFATDKWFKHIRGEMLTEGLADIGLDEMIQRKIEAKMPEASEKGRMWVGAAWKSLDGKRISNYGWFEGFLRRTIMERVKSFQVGENNILLNLVSAYTTQSVGKWTKAKRKFARNSLRFKVPNREVSQTILDLKVLEERTWGWFSSRIENVIITLNQNPNNYEIIKSIPPSDYQQAEQECFDFQQTKEDPDKIMHTFGDGSYWYDLDTYQCDIEGDRMGHCGRDERGTLYSLRKKEEGKKASKSYITIAYNAQDQTIYQIKGRQNTCPPAALWTKIAKFIEITGAERLEETGEYSNDEEAFQELGKWLDANTSISFERSFEKRLEEFREEVERLESEWERSRHSLQVDYDGASVEALEGFEGLAPVWYASATSIASILPFDLTEEKMRTFYAVGSEDPPDLALTDEIEEAIMKIVEEEDRNDILSNKYTESYAYLLKADNYGQAFLKADNMSRLKREDREQLTKGSDTYVVIWDISQAFEDYVENESNKTEAEGIEEWYGAINELVDDLNDSLDAIEDVLVSRKLAPRSELKGYIGKVEEEFNNFIVSQPSSNREGKYTLQASDVLFKITKPQAQALSQIGLAEHPPNSADNGGYYGSWTMTIAFWDFIFEHTRQAMAFAKQQIKLNFGDKFKEPADSNLDDSFDKFEANSTIGIAYKNFNKNDPKINYKIVTSISKRDLPILGPYLEYFDNNFDIIIKAFEKGVREEIKKAEKEFGQKTGNDTNLPVEEGKLITEGLADIGLPDDVVGLIKEKLPSASEKGRVWVGNAFKAYSILGPPRDLMMMRLVIFVDEHYQLFQFGDNPEANSLLNLDRALRAGTIKDVIKARKSFVKAASKLGVEQAITNKILQLADTALQGSLNHFLEERVNNVITTLNQNPNNYEMLKGFPPYEWAVADEKMFEYQSNIENPEQIIHTFDDGSYWYDLKTSKCKNEGSRMGHCGAADYGRLYSLRKKDKGKKESKSYVTISYNSEDKTIHQIKGRGNEAPPEQLWKHIAEFVRITGATYNEEDGRHSGDGDSFVKLAKYLNQETGIGTYVGTLIETMKKAAAGPIKDQLAKWDAEDRGESLQEAGNPLDVRLYEIDYVMSYPLGQGFEITDIHNIIRAIPDVTTVRSIGNAKRSQGNRTVSLQRLKFALQGQKHRVEWIKQILLPQIHKISSKIRIHKVDRAELVSSSKQRLEESYYNSTMRQSPGRTTPLPSVQNLIDDWVEGGVMYDQPTNHNLTRYSVMMPVEDLKHLCGREARKHGHHFDAGYENFIQNGPRDPIYLAIGKNGRAKITGNEDDLRYAIKAGVEEVPVFISYQRQV